jgi:hypothetical protein
MIKYRLAFTIPAETLFGLVAKVLPIEDLSVEEIVEQRTAVTPQIERPKRKRKHFARANLETGVNAIVLGVLSDGKAHPTSEFKPAMARQGYSAAGSGSALEKLKKRGLIHQPDFGMWQLTENKQKQSA